LIYVCDGKLDNIIQKYEIFLEHQIYTQSDESWWRKKTMRRHKTVQLKVMIACKRNWKCICEHEYEKCICEHEYENIFICS